ncbi:unnamed protein product [Dovyalis caffra]|uniref:Uncharacterized protein n=1 Tax=Dovyalis caffra TaxID=77055 RepID=A0AAV1S9Q8_9ROSI|nr:unnamed protein product [Dovyalis caffra]
MAAGPVSPTDHQGTPPVVPVPMMMADAIAKDAILAWFRGEFAAANAIIDALCSHLAQLGAGSEYEAVFAAIHGRRLNWIPVLQMQKYHSIAEVSLELKRVAETKQESESAGNRTDEVSDEKVKISVENGHVAEEEEEEDSPDSDITDSDPVGLVGVAGSNPSSLGGPAKEKLASGLGSQEVQPASENNDDICANHEDCSARPTQIKLTKGFTAKEHVNVVKGLKLYEDVFTDPELSKLTDFVNELRVAGQNGELSGETFILFNKQVKGNKRELIQLGVPIFGHIREEAAGNIEPIPGILQGVVDHLVQWQLIPEYKKPNGCIIHFFDEEEYSQPFLKPPHLDQPISTLILSESTMAFGRILGSDSDGNYRGSLSLLLKKGYVCLRNLYDRHLSVRE